MKARSSRPAPSPYVTGLLGRCPNCGKGKLFKGVLAVAKGCQACGLDYSFADAGDGPAIFVMFIAGVVICGLALWIDVNFDLPIWLNLLICTPASLLIGIACLRPLKGLMVALQYVNKAEEVRFVDKEEQVRWRD